MTTSGGDGSVVELSEIEEERIGRLRAELDLAVCKAQLARERLDRCILQVCRERGVNGPVELELHENGVRLRSRGTT